KANRVQGTSRALGTSLERRRNGACRGTAPCTFDRRPGPLLQLRVDGHLHPFPRPFEEDDTLFHGITVLPKGERLGTELDPFGLPHFSGKRRRPATLVLHRRYGFAVSFQ